MTEQQTVCEGQYYTQKLDVPGPDILIWRVESVFDTALHMPHARLVAVRDPMASKMISCRTLTNPAYYERVAVRPYAMDPSERNALNVELAWERLREHNSSVIWRQMRRKWLEQDTATALQDQETNGWARPGQIERDVA